MKIMRNLVPKLHKDSVTIQGGGPIIAWVTVPLHPTIEMLRAAGHACDGLNLSKLNRIDKSRYKAAKRWEAMLAVAPTPSPAASQPSSTEKP